MTRGKRGPLRRKHPATDRAVVWQAASLLLAYPDEQQPRRLELVSTAAPELVAEQRERLLSVVAHLRATPLVAAQEHFVEMFDMRGRRTLYLTYWVAGDTRNRGGALLRFADAYRAAGVRPPPDELPDHLAVVLEFAATIDADRGYALLAEHRTPVTLLREALRKAGTPYTAVIDAVRATLPTPGPDDLREARRLTMSGPPVETVGLEPFPIVGRGSP